MREEVAHDLVLECAASRHGQRNLIAEVMLTRCLEAHPVRSQGNSAMGEFQIREAGRRGFTLVELLVVIAIIGILVGMLLPAVEASREAGRKAQCMNNLKQMANGALQHESAQGFFPTGGWGYQWGGDPDRGFTKLQPGGWIYNLLPYVGEQALHDLGKGLPEPPPGSRTTLTTADLAPPFADKQAALLALLRTPLAMMNCPSRRRTVLYPMNWNQGFLAFCGNAGLIFMSPASADLVARTDYVANYGSTGAYEYFTGPVTLTQGDDPAWAGNWHTPQNGCLAQNGISYERSEIGLALITDGASNTIMCGEKYLGPDWYYTGLDGADNESMYCGFNNDSHRSTAAPPLRDTPGYGDGFRFGSPHYGGAHFGLCDGSVRRISYGVDPLTFQNLGSRPTARPSTQRNFDRASPRLADAAPRVQ